MIPAQAFSPSVALRLPPGCEAPNRVRHQAILPSLVEVQEEATATGSLTATLSADINPDAARDSLVKLSLRQDDSVAIDPIEQ
jgi:hypothetical protein